MLSSLSGKTPGNLLTRAAQTVEAERRRELEEAELREEQRKNPLTPTHVLRSQQRMRRRGSTELYDWDQSELQGNLPTSRSDVVRSDYFGKGIWGSSNSSGVETPSVKHIHFNDRVEQCIAVEIKYDADINVIEEDDSEDEELFIGGKYYPVKVEHSTIAKLPATTLRPGDEPIRETPPLSSFFGRRASQEDLSETGGFYYEEGGAFSSSASPPEFPHNFAFDQDDQNDMFSFEHSFDSHSNIDNNIPSNTASTASSRQSSDFGSDEEVQKTPVSGMPIRNSQSVAFRDHEGMMGEEEDEGIGIVGLAADAISTAKDIVGVLWNASWGGNRR